MDFIEKVEAYCAQNQKHRELSESTETPGSIASPWPAKDIVKKLVEATEILLNDKNYDGHGWEQIHAAKKEAEDWLMQYNVKITSEFTSMC